MASDRKAQAGSITHRISARFQSSTPTRAQVSSQVHFHKPEGKPLPSRHARATAARSPVRSAIEHVFAGQKHRMKLFVRAIGIARATMKIGMTNLAYNFSASPGSTPELRLNEEIQSQTDCKIGPPAVEIAPNNTVTAKLALNIPTRRLKSQFLRLSK